MTRLYLKNCPNEEVRIDALSAEGGLVFVDFLSGPYFVVVLPVVARRSLRGGYLRDSASSYELELIPSEI